MPTIDRMWNPAMVTIKPEARAPAPLTKLLIRSAALAACSAGILADETLLIRTGAATGVFGAVAFAVFAVNVPLQLRATRRSA